MCRAWADRERGDGVTCEGHVDDWVCLAWSSQSCADVILRDTESLAISACRIGEVLIAKAAERMYVPFCQF